MARLFYLHGKLCASHPWEVIVAFAILAIALFSMGPHLLFDQNSNGQSTTTTTTTATATSSGLPMAMAAHSEMYFGQADSVTPPPHLSPDSYKSANVVSDDSLSQNRYFRHQKQKHANTAQHHRHHLQQQCPQKSLDCAPREVSVLMLMISSSPSTFSLSTLS